MGLHTRAWAVFSLVLVCAAGQAAGTPKETAGLLTPAEPSAVQVEALTSRRSRPVRVHPEVLTTVEARTVVRLELFPDLDFEAALERLTAHTSGRQVWLGHLRGRPNTAVTLVLGEGLLAGAVHAGPEGTFEIRPAASGLHLVREKAPGALTTCGGVAGHADLDRMRADGLDGSDKEPAEPEGKPPLESAFVPPASTCDDGTVIDLMVVYTQSAVAAAGRTAAIEGLIELAVSDTNAAFARSGIHTSIRLVHSQQVNYAESGLGAVDGPRLTDPADGYLDDVPPLRDQHGADCVSLWVNNLDSGGIGYYPHPSLTGTGASGYTVMRQDNAAFLTLAHELGHNLWCAHDRENDTPPPPFAEYSHGYREPGSQWRTIMAYPPGFVIPYFANPTVNYPGPVNPGPTGIAAHQPSPCDVALTINQTRLIVASFRATRVFGLPSVLRVRASAPAGGDGLSWATAFNNLQEAMCRAGGSNGDVTEIWVAEGTYRPDSGSGDRGRSFLLASGLALYGGFAGTETSRSQRNPSLHPTVLSGDIGTPGVATDNAYHVVRAEGVDATAVLDGFTIASGRADGANWPDDVGGGLYVADGSPKIAGCVFSSNYAAGGGGGICALQAAPAIIGCTFAANDGGNWGGGGLLNHLDTHSLVTGCTFQSNTALFGGGVLNAYGSGGSISDCEFVQNTAAPGNNAGGGLYCLVESSPLIEGCTFSDNVAQYGAGLALNTDCSPTLRDCAFEQNHGPGPGSANAAIDAYLRCNPLIEACTFTGNAADYAGAIGLNDACSPTISGCLFTANAALHGGGACYFYLDCAPVISDCTFTANLAEWAGAIACDDHCVPEVRGCTFRDQAVLGGGGVINLYGNSDALFDRCLFAGNSADYAGVLLTDTDSAPLFANSLFTGNTANLAGVAACYGGSAPELTNCTVVGNHADFAGGVYALASSPRLRNTILWANGDNNGTIESSQVFYSSAAPDLASCIVQGWTGGLGGTANIGSNPLFVDADGPDNVHGTADDNARLQPGSPAIDTGNNAFVSLAMDRDLAGSFRLLAGTVDRGAYEWVPPVPGDFNRDGTVDDVDLAGFLTCGTGPRLGPPSAGCLWADLDMDNDVDTTDFGKFQRCLTGPDVAGDPHCAD